MEHNRPDLTIVNHISKLWTFVDFSVPWDKNVLAKEEEKITNSSPLADGIRKMHKVSTNIIRQRRVIRDFLLFLCQNVLVPWHREVYKGP
jgi:hypothetical protein